MVGKNEKSSWDPRRTAANNPTRVVAAAIILVLAVVAMFVALASGCAGSGSSTESTTSSVSGAQPGWTGGRGFGTGSSATSTTPGASELSSTGSSESATEASGTTASSPDATTTPDSLNPQTIASQTGDTGQSTTPPTLVTADYAKGVSDGIYLVGTDISSGLYKGIATAPAAQWEISWDANGGRFIIGGDPVGQFYLKVASGQYLRLHGVNIVKASSSRAATLLTGGITDGTYRVGYDIAVGWYQGATNGSLGYWEISSDANAQSLVACDYVKGPFSLKVKSGQFLTLRGVTVSQ